MMAIEIETLRARIKDSYQSFSSYESAGTIRSTEIGPERTGWFKIYFLKPNRVRLEWSGKEGDDDKSVLIVNGSKAQLLLSKWTLKFSEGKIKIKKLEEVMDVSTAMSMAGDITQGMSDAILPLLVENSGRPCFLENKLDLLRDEWVDEEPCYQLRELSVYGPRTVWVSHNGFTVRLCQIEGPPPFVTGALTMGLPNRSFVDPNSLPPEPRNLQANSQEWLFRSVQYNQLAEDSAPYSFAPGTS
jgi:hypothetical protein